MIIIIISASAAFGIDKMIDRYPVMAIGICAGITLCFIFSAVMFPVILSWQNVKKYTYINVYENGITGRGIGRSFRKGQDFSIPYEQILNIDISYNFITVYTSYDFYKCYFKNLTESREIHSCMSNQLKNKK